MSTVVSLNGDVAEQRYADACRDWRVVNDKYLGSMRAVLKAQNALKIAVARMDSQHAAISAATERRTEALTAVLAHRECSANAGLSASVGA